VNCFYDSFLLTVLVPGGGPLAPTLLPSLLRRTNATARRCYQKHSHCHPSPLFLLHLTDEMRFALSTRNAKGYVPLPTCSPCLPRAPLVLVHQHQDILSPLGVPEFHPTLRCSIVSAFALSKESSWRSDSCHCPRHVPAGKNQFPR